jgi:hypothetical protein
MTALRQCNAEKKSEDGWPEGRRYTGNYKIAAWLASRFAFVRSFK